MTLRVICFLFFWALFFGNMTTLRAETVLGAEKREVAHQDQGYSQEIEEMFSLIVKPRKGNFLRKSLRFKKYKIVQKNLEDFKKYLTGKNLQERQSQAAQIVSAYEILYDKILWIDDFKTGRLKYFSSPFYADRFFKNHDGIFNNKVNDSERKKDG